MDYTKRIAELREEQNESQAQGEVPDNTAINEVYGEEARAINDRNQVTEQAVKGRLYSQATPPESGRAS
jgi:hypothetical protein